MIQKSAYKSALAAGQDLPKQSIINVGHYEF